MALHTKNKRSLEFSAASMSDLVFLLLIFFMLTSTLISPNAIKLLLPNSSSKTMAKQTLTVYINDELQYFVEENPVTEQSLENTILQKISNQDNATIVLRADKTVPIQYIINIIDAVNNINKSTKTKHKVILATSPKK